MNTVRAYKTLQIESGTKGKLGVRGKRESGQSQSVGEKAKAEYRNKRKRNCEMIDKFGMR